MIDLFLLFVEFFKIGLFTIGGGVASLPLIETLVVNNHNWLSYEEFSHLVVISEMTPGPIAVNASTFVGNKMFGIIGGIVATAGVILPSLIIVIVLAKIYLKYKNIKTVNSILNGLRPTVVGLVAFATLNITVSALFNSNVLKVSTFDFNIVKIALLVLYVFILRKYKPNPIAIIALSGIVGFVVL